MTNATEPFNENYEADDTLRIREAYPEATVFLTDAAIQGMYSEWSEREYCASWLNMTPGVLREFGRYAFAERGP